MPRTLTVTCELAALDILCEFRVERWRKDQEKNPLPVSEKELAQFIRYRIEQSATTSVGTD